MASDPGGMEIEEVAKENPDAILREPIHPATLACSPIRRERWLLGWGFRANR